MRTCGDSYESTEWRDHVAAQMAMARGERYPLPAAAVAELRASLIARGVTADSPRYLDPEAERLAAQERQN